MSPCSMVTILWFNIFFVFFRVEFLLELVHRPVRVYQVPQLDLHLLLQILICIQHITTHVSIVLLNQDGTSRRNWGC